MDGCMKAIVCHVNILLLYTTLTEMYTWCLISKTQGAFMTDKQLIEQLGGAAAVARILNFKALGGTQRVQNWKTRGIPAAIKVAFPHIFMATPAANKSQAKKNPPSTSR